MKVLLLAALACLVSATEEPLPFSGNFTTIYLASKYGSVMEENSQFRMLIREVKFFKNYKVMSMTFYVGNKGKCQLHTVWADKPRYKVCFTGRYFAQAKCKNQGSKNIIGNWLLHDAYRHFPQIYSYPEVHGGLTRRPSEFYVFIHFYSNTTILFEANFLNRLGNKLSLTAALATGTNLTEEMWKEYVNLTRHYKIPIENIKNVYEADTCPK